MKKAKMEEYKNILYCTKNPGYPNQYISLNNSALQPLSEFLVTVIPARLYRYRQCIERNYDALMHDQVWVSCAETMNDGFDARLFFDINSISDWLEKLFSSESTDAIFSMIKGGMAPSELLKQFIPDIEKLLQTAMDIPEDVMKMDIGNKLKVFKEMTLEMVPQLSIITQKSLKFACFSENIKSTVMWGQYAANETGFAVAYDFSSGQLSSCQICNKPAIGECSYPKTCSLLPVIYGAKRHKVSDDYIKYLLAIYLVSRLRQQTGNSKVADAVISGLCCPDMSEATKLAVHKSTEWAYEKEWRIFCSSADPYFNNQQHSFFPKKASAIYLGRKISTYNEKTLKDIAKEKGLPIYKMAVNDKSSTYNLIPKIIK